LEDTLHYKEFILVYDNESNEDSPIVNLPTSYPVRVAEDVWTDTLPNEIT